MTFLCLQASTVWERYGGIESYLDDLLSLSHEAGSPAQGISVALTSKAVSGSGKYPITFVRKQLPGPLKRLENRFSPFLFQTALAVARDRQPKFILCGHVNLGPLCYALGKKLGIPVVTVVYGIEAWGNLAPQDEWALKQSHKIISISEWTKTRLIARGYGAHKIEIAAPTLPASAQSWPKRQPGGDTKRPLTLLTVARLDSGERYKGHDHVLQALARAKKLRPSLNLRYVIQGEGSDKGYLEKIVRHDKLDDVVEFLPAVKSREELGALYASADVFVMPSRFGFWDGRWRGEGFGIVYLEAAACEVPSIAYDCGGATDAIVSGKTGWLLHPDHVSGLADLFIELDTKRELITEYGINARRHVLEKFSRDMMKKALVKALTL